MTHNLVSNKPRSKQGYFSSNLGYLSSHLAIVKVVSLALSTISLKVFEIITSLHSLNRNIYHCFSWN